MTAYFRMLRKNGTGAPIPWNEIVAQKEGMIEVQMTKEEIDKAFSRAKPVIGYLERQHTTRDSKPGTGWIKNKFGNWKRKLPKKQKIAEAA